MPSMLAFSAAVVATALYALQAYGGLTALFAIAVMASSVQWLASATVARVDMVLAACLCVAMVSFEAAHRRGRAPSAVFHLACAAAVLAKGPVGWVLPALVVIAYLGVVGDLRYLLRLRPGWVAVTILVPVAWYTAAAWQGGRPFVDKVVIAENFLRVVDAEGAGLGHVRPFYAYATYLLGGFVPWSLFLPS